MMINGNILTIIKEEIHNFDFLGNDAILKEQGEANILRDENFQKEFIYDSIKNKRNIKTNLRDSNISDNDDNLDVYVVYDIEYNYGSADEPLTFRLTFDGKKIPFDVQTEYEKETKSTPSSRESWIQYIDWTDIDVTLYSDLYDDIDFKAIDNAPNKIKELFIREYIEYDIMNSTDVDIRN